MLIFVCCMGYAQNQKTNIKHDLLSVQPKQQSVHKNNQANQSPLSVLGSCNQQNPSNNVEVAYATSSDTPQIMATDITVPADTNFTLNTIKTNFLVTPGATIEFADIIFYNNAVGIPDSESVVNTQISVIPVSQTRVGDAGGLDIVEVTFDIAPVLLAGRTLVSKTYWVSLYVTASEDTAYIEATTATVAGLPQAYSFDGIDWYTHIIIDFVYDFQGDCTPITSGNFPEIGNDICTTATNILCGQSLTGDTTANTNQGGSPFGSQDQWFKYTGSGAAEFVTLSLCESEYDTRIIVYDACDGNIVTENDDTCGIQSRVTFVSDGNTTYYVAVEGFDSTDAGAFTLTATCLTIPAAPANDAIANSINISQLQLPYTDVAVGLPGATTEAGEPQGCSLPSINGVWYHFTATSNGTATGEIVSPQGSPFVVFYTAPSGVVVETDLNAADPENVACSERSEATIPVITGQTYYVYVANTLGISDVTISGDFLLGTKNHSFEGFSVSPNPATGNINLKSTQHIDEASLYNLLGQKVSEKQFDTNEGTMDVSELASGTYILKVSIDGKTGNYKIIRN